jgi:drug/metabolite transporter (DMT)-like permease
LVFREHLGWRSVAAIVIIVAAGAILGDRPGEGATRWPGALSIAGACLVWAVDNNLTQRLSVRDPVAVVRIKTLAAAACSLAIAFSRGATLPPLSLVAAALAIGVASYGLSVLLDVYALRMLGAAREAAFFATAPFVGALVAVPVLAEVPGRIEWIAGTAMIGGVILLLRDRHAHAHTHEVIEHDHRHVHDEHHRHEHSGVAGGAAEPHSHPHRHQPITHAHPHNSDIHHRHRH